MAIDGRYGFVYCGANGLGIGAFIIEAGEVRGRDYGLGEYRGTAVENADGTISLKLNFLVPAGMVLVQGTSPQELPHTRYIDDVFPPLFGDGAPIQASTPPVTVMVKKLPPEDGLPALLGVK
jgi:hypothetical protein